MKLRRFSSSLALACLLACGSVAPALAQSAAPAESAPATQAVPPLNPVPAPAAHHEGHGEAHATDNPYGLQALWSGSDAVAKVVLLLMVIMSAGSWYIIIAKLFEQAKMNRQAKAVTGVWKSATVKHGAENLEQGSPFRFIAEAGLEATNKHDSLLEHVDLNDWVTLSIQRAIERVQSRMQNGLAFLATVGSTAPFVGLFGTVWGIYHALTAIGIAGQASIDKVAGPVGEALIMTAIGLAVAVPAVLGYNWLVRRNKGVMDQVRGFGNELHTVILSSAKRA
ncbi:MotA/TolQ/ExbB proton channel family protein [Azoarcus indigens]|uniref:Biopolymer transport protein ExbB n=1 Tax=Azoarcus indigens TaxID=29545 RepID=A0A4V3BLK0_9RHOO|nr:MotA/TolQ/ExbB proton channel family protein [Azoarcus indigens]NMG67298.1 MotA/TolQ/ExbB proton channel family protein [Azoarcus indigens]TDN46932.1 outer membrane transport energization protein ExbB [Azoarcus indigens]